MFKLNVIVRLLFGRRRSELVLEKRQYKPCEWTVVRLWNWNYMRYEKFLVHLTPDGRWNIKKLGES